MYCQPAYISFIYELRKRFACRIRRRLIQSGNIQKVVAHSGGLAENRCEERRFAGTIG